MRRRSFIVGAAATALAVAAGGLPFMDPSIPATLRDSLNDLDRRLRNLERSPQLTNSSIKGGQLRVLRADGSPVAALGTDPDDGNAVGSVLYASDGSILAAFGQVPALSGADGIQLGPTASPTVLWNATDGQLRPHVITPWVANGSVPRAITAGTFTLCFDAWFERLSTKYLHIRLDIGVDAGCTGEIRVVHVGGDTSNVLTLSSVPGQIFTCELAWAPSSFALNATAKLRLEARRTAGSFAINLYEPYGAELGDFRSTATSGGAWTYS